MIRFENVSYTYPFQEIPAVQNISFQVAPGELLLCTGASGCGKSTLVRLANGLCPHYYHGKLEGQVLVNSQATTEQSVPALARMAGTLFQDPEQQFFALNVEDEMAFALEWQGLDQQEMVRRIQHMTREFSLQGVLASSIHDLSEGQKQKVGLASLCAQKPMALILDEPSANLDPEATVALAWHLRDLKNQGLAIFVVDHRLYWLEGIADRVIVMSGGQVVEQGPFSLLQSEELRCLYGLRSPRVEDVRERLSSPTDTVNLAAVENFVLDVQGLDFAHKGQAKLFDQAGFSLPQGITALIGHNGVGKTTLARILAGLHKTHGQFKLHGQPCEQQALLAHTGIVLQNADHQLHMRSVATELENCLALAQQAQGKDKAKNKGEALASLSQQAMELMALFGLQHLAQRHPQSLSGGEKQRLVIACALAKKPGILVLDEPTSGLDGENMQRLGNVLQEAAARGICILLITHDLELMQNICQFGLRLPLHSIIKEIAA